MKRNFKLALALTFVSCVALFGATAQKATINMRMNVLSADPKGNFFNWTAGNTSVKDSYDVASGASKAQSTTAFDAVRYDSNTSKKLAIPAALRGLVLYPVADFKTAQDDDLTVTTNGKEVTIRYIHRGTAYQLKTDSKGNLNVLTGCSIAKNVASNVGGEFVLNPEYVKAGGDPKKMSSLDWSKVTLVPDTYESGASRWYTGNLAVKYNKGILTVKGTLTETK